MRYRGTFDNTPDVVRFAENLERVCVGTVQSGDPVADDNQFLDKLDSNLTKAMA